VIVEQQYAQKLSEYATWNSTKQKKKENGMKIESKRKQKKDKT